MLLFKRMHFKISSAKFRPSCTSLNVLTFLSLDQYGSNIPGNTKNKKEYQNIVLQWLLQMCRDRI